MVHIDMGHFSHKNRVFFRSLIYLLQWKALCTCRPMKQFYENKEVLRELHDDIACHIALDEPLKQSNCNDPQFFNTSQYRSRIGTYVEKLMA